MDPKYFGAASLRLNSCALFDPAQGVKLQLRNPNVWPLRLVSRHTPPSSSSSSSNSPPSFSAGKGTRETSEESEKSSNCRNENENHWKFKQQPKQPDITPIAPLTHTFRCWNKGDLEFDDAALTKAGKTLGEVTFRIGSFLRNPQFDALLARAQQQHSFLVAANRFARLRISTVKVGASFFLKVFSGFLKRFKETSSTGHASDMEMKQEKQNTNNKKTGKKERRQEGVKLKVKRKVKVKRLQKLLIHFMTGLTLKSFCERSNT